MSSFDPKESADYERDGFVVVICRCYWNSICKKFLSDISIYTVCTTNMYNRIARS